MKAKLQKNQKGFTIIEVLIVLAIAGLILLIVFLAVPALQRNSRNTQRKNDAQLLLSAYSEYATNNGGQIPTEIGGTGNTVTLSRGGTTPTQDVNLSFYDATEVIEGADNNPVTPAGEAESANLYINTGAKCDGAGDFGGANPTARSVAVAFAVETQGGAQPTCQES